VLQEGHRGCRPTGLNLIDGGRFLASVAWESCTLALWDLGSAGLAPKGRPRLAASLDLDALVVYWQTAAWCVVGDLIRCALACRVARQPAKYVDQFVLKSIHQYLTMDRGIQSPDIRSGHFTARPGCGIYPLRYS